MKTLVVAMSLTLGAQAIAGKRLSEFLAIAWPQLTVATVGTAGSFAFLDPTLALIMSASITGGVGLSLVEPLLDRWAERTDERGWDTVGKKILYRDDDGSLKLGKTVAYTSPFFYDYGGLHIAGEETLIEMFDIVATSIPDHHDIGREVELLTEAEDTALHYAGVVVAAFDNGSYELELLAKVDVLLDPSVTDAAYHYIDIEPRRLIVAKNVALKDGGFRFARRENSPREEELLLDTASRQDHRPTADARSFSSPDVEK